MTKRESQPNGQPAQRETSLYPYLDSLIGGWFHEDYRIDGDTLEQIVGSYKKVYSVEVWRSTITDIQRFLDTRDDRQIKEDFISVFQPGVDPEAWDMSTRQWLLRIAELLR